MQKNVLFSKTLKDKIELVVNIVAKQCQKSRLDNETQSRHRKVSTYRVRLWHYLWARLSDRYSQVQSS